MKKSFVVYVAVLAVLLILLTVNRELFTSSSIGVIGGADGPTSIIVATNPSLWLRRGLVFLGILTAAALLVAAKRRK